MVVEMISHHRWNRGGASRVLRKFFFFFFPGSRIRAIRQVSTGRREGVSRTGSEDFLTLPDVEFGKIDNNCFRGKTNFKCDLKEFSKHLTRSEAVHYIPHHSRQVPRVNWDNILSSPKKKKPTKFPFLSHVSQTAISFG